MGKSPKSPLEGLLPMCFPVEFLAEKHNRGFKASENGSNWHLPFVCLQLLEIMSFHGFFLTNRSALRSSLFQRGPLASYRRYYPSTDRLTLAITGLHTFDPCRFPWSLTDCPVGTVHSENPCFPEVRWGEEPHLTAL